MEGIDILFVGIGLLCVAVSFFLSEKLSGGKKKEEQLMEELKQEVLTEVQKKENLEQILSGIKKEVAEHTEELTEDLLLDIRDRMDQMTNEKMLAFGEYADQVMEKLHQDHTEVVFLYDMLKEKESMLRDFAARVDGIRMQIQALIVQAEKAVEKEAASVRSGSETKAVRQEKVIKQEAEKTAPKKSRRSGAAAAAGASVPAGDTAARPAGAAGGSVAFGGAAGEQNKRILELYREGKSIVEISKSLGLGQGEVKLVIDLFRESK